MLGFQAGFKIEKTTAFQAPHPARLKKFASAAYRKSAINFLF
jgi:hypothetical protein